jgi:DNA polymerase
VAHADDGAPGAGYDATPYLPARGRLPAHRRAAADCRGCPLYADATQTVFGAGGPRARVVLVGEQPGDREDREGKPFVGPAGRVLDRALEEAGLADEPVYRTNAVKHFRFGREAGGKRRIHKPPTLREVSACRPWLTAELRLVRPEVVVALGATAGRSLLGPDFRVTKDRGTVRETAVRADGAVVPGPDPATAGKALVVARVVPTIHPSAVLRAEDRDAVYAGLLADLRVAAEQLAR